MGRVAWIVAALVTVSAVASDHLPANVAKDRNLSLYDAGGVYRTAIGAHQLTDIERLRQFIWSHWTQKRRGYVEFVFRGKDAGSENYFFIEPAGDSWRIAWVEQHYQALPGYSPPPPQIHRDIVTIKRVRGALTFLDAKNRIVTHL
jgi:hypothetical protein